MARARTKTPAGHGELLTEPAYGAWADVMHANEALVATWDFEVCGTPAADLRAMARMEAIARAREFSARMGVPVGAVADEPDRIVMTGHQPQLYHPGIWIKDFLLQRLADETGAAAIDLVVDSDGFDSVEVHSPCLRPHVMVCRAYLAVGREDGCFMCAGAPSIDDIDGFCAAGGEHLGTLSAPALGHHFSRFCECLRDAAKDAGNLAETVTFARRRFEVSAGTDYLELPVSSMAGSRAFASFVGHIALDAPAFVSAYNAALDDFRDRTGVRSAAQPFPDLRQEGDLFELPFWHLGSSRRTVWARPGASTALVVDGDVVCEFAGCDDAPGAIMDSGLAPAPKALSLTLYSRLFVADFFIHGVGGGGYDQVTDDVIRRYFGVEAPRFGVASLTMYLPLGARVVGDEEVDAVAQALNRLKHNPDQMLGEVEFDTPGERTAAVALATEKGRLVAEIAAPGADKKTLGRRIREVNEELAAMLAHYERQLAEELEELGRMREAAEILTDRTYPFCFWSPSEVADKAR
jgi:hypothetical protein